MLSREEDEGGEEQEQKEEEEEEEGEKGHDDGKRERRDRREISGMRSLQKFNRMAPTSRGVSPDEMASEEPPLKGLFRDGGRVSDRFHLATVSILQNHSSRELLSPVSLSSIAK